MKDSEVLIKSLMNNVPFGFIVLKPSGTIQRINLKAKSLLLLKRPMAELRGARILHCIHHIPLLSEQLSGFLKDPGPSSPVIPVLLNNRHLDISIHLIHDGIMIIVNDTTALKELEANSVQAIITSQENERRRLARELHDGIAPLLSSARLELDLFLEELRSRDSEIPDANLLNIRRTIDSISDDLRDLSHRLIPRLLEEFGLLSAFQNMVTRTKNTTRSQIDFYCNIDQEERVEKEIELTLFRCGQELLHNAIKYANARKITVQLIRHEKSIVLMVEDDGIGFDSAGYRSGSEGIGLTNIETRIRTLNGALLIESAANRGTLVSIEIPV
jgi:signal transduction histidine kinase